MPVYATETNRRRVDQAVKSGNLPTGRNLESVVAYVNHGRWVADCPCAGAEVVSPGVDMRCGSCGMTSPVKFPKKADQDRINGLLEKRPPMNQNWRGENVADLLGENIAKGLES